MKYEDEDKEWVKLTCNSDVEHALRLSRSFEVNVVNLTNCFHFKDMSQFYLLDSMLAT